MTTATATTVHPHSNGSRCRPSCPPTPEPRHRSAVPGLLLVAAATALAFGVHSLVPAANPSTVAVVLGALLVNAGLHRPALHVGQHVPPGAGVDGSALGDAKVVLDGDLSTPDAVAALVDGPFTGRPAGHESTGPELERQPVRGRPAT